MIKKNNSVERKKDAEQAEDTQLKRESVIDSQNDESIIPFDDIETLDDDKVFIECPGATVYEPGTRNVVAGIEFVDENDPEKGYRIVSHQVFAPDHRRRRLIKREHRNSIRRCQACQDLTVRLIRREGPDFFIPSPKHPRKTRLKPVEKNW